MQAVNGASQHMEKKIHLSEALGTTQPFLRYFFFLGHFYFQKLDGMTPVKENILFCGCFGDQARTCFFFFFAGSQWIPDGLHANKSIFGVYPHRYSIEYRFFLFRWLVFSKLLNYIFGAKSQFTKFFNKVGQFEDLRQIWGKKVFKLKV